LTNSKLDSTKGAKIAAIYLIVAGLLGILWPLTDLGPHHPEFQVKSFAFKLGSYVRSNVINLFFIISGIGLLYRKTWARKMAMVILVIGAIYTANEFAWGYAMGNPALVVRLLSFVAVGVWNGIWFYLIFRKKKSRIQQNHGIIQMRSLK
jgi:hypothetical protein